MTNKDVQAQYETYPYPERKPEDERKRLILGSPSWPQEMDHFLWGGARDWKTPLKALVAGGGTGDGLIQLAQSLTDAGRPYEITYLDMSKAARAIAEARAELRGLSGIIFETGSLLDAAQYGTFDYIDCCGVLHHLPDPQAGFDALAAALAPDGGIGLMVYAPYGRTGVYPLQEAFGALFAGMKPEARLKQARAIFNRLPPEHPFKRNAMVGDHKVSDAGFYDLLLHSQDRAYTITDLNEALENAGLELAAPTQPLLYDPRPLLAPDVQVPMGMRQVEQMALAEKLRGTFKTHVIYARPKGAVIAPPLGQEDAIPHFRGGAPAQLAQVVGKTGGLKINDVGIEMRLSLPKAAAPIIARADGTRSLAELRADIGLSPSAFAAAWTPVERALSALGLMHHSTLLRG